MSRRCRDSCSPEPRAAPAAPARGLELVRRVKALPSAPAVVAMTLFHTHEAAAAAMGAGAHALVGKESFVPGLAQALAALFPA